MINFFLNLSDVTRWKKLIYGCFIFLIILGLYIPLIIFILLSFNPSSDKQSVASTLSSNLGFSNYVSFFTDSSFTGNMWSSLSNSLIIALTSIPIALPIGLFTSISIWRNCGKGKNSVFLFSNITISCPDIVQAIAFFLLFSTILTPFGLNLGFLSVILTHVALLIPYSIIFLYPRLNKLNQHLFLSAYDLNFNLFEALKHVIIPILTPDLMGTILLLFSISFDDYIITNFIRGSVSTISSELYTMKTGIKAWASVLGSIIITLVTFFVLIYNLVEVINNKKKNRA